MPPFQVNPLRGDSSLAAKAKSWTPAPLDRTRATIIALLDREQGPGSALEEVLIKVLRSKGLKQDGKAGFTVRRYVLPAGSAETNERIAAIAGAENADILVPLDLSALYACLEAAPGKRILYCTSGAPLLPRLPQVTGIVLPTVYGGREDLGQFMRLVLPPGRRFAVIFEPGDWASVEYKEHIAEFLGSENLEFECIGIDDSTPMMEIADSVRNRDATAVWLAPGQTLSRAGAELMSYVLLSRTPIIGFAPGQSAQGASVVLGPDWVTAIEALADPITRVIRGEMPGSIHPTVSNSTIVMKK